MFFEDIPLLVDLAQKGVEAWKELTLEARVTFVGQMLQLILHIFGSKIEESSTELDVKGLAMCHIAPCRTTSSPNYQARVRKTKLYLSNKSFQL